MWQRGARENTIRWCAINLMFSASRNYKETVTAKVTWMMEEKREEIQRERMRFIPSLTSSYLCPSSWASQFMPQLTPSHFASHALFTFPDVPHFGMALDPPQLWIVLVLSLGPCGSFALPTKCQRARLKCEVRSGVMQSMESERDKYLNIEAMQSL